MIKDTTNKFISLKFTTEEQKSQVFIETDNQFYKDHISSRYKQDEQRFRKIVDDYIMLNQILLLT